MGADPARLCSTRGRLAFRYDYRYTLGQQPLPGHLEVDWGPIYVLGVGFMKYRGDNRVQPEAYCYASDWDEGQVPSVFKRTASGCFLSGEQRWGSII